MTDVLALRTAAGLTQARLAEISGVAQPNIAAYESGSRTPSPTMVARLRAAARPRPGELLNAHRETVREIVRRHRASKPRVFGSVARAEDQSGSDLDLLVRFDDDADLFDLAELVADLEDLLGIQVDVVSEAGLPTGLSTVRDEARPL